MTSVSIRGSKAMRGAILAIGDELTLGQSLDTNSAWLADQLAGRGIIVDEHRTVADVREAIARVIRELAQDCDVLIVTGGLGPTEDDVTREALGDAFTPSEPLVEDADARQWLDEWFAGRGREMPQSNLRQCFRPKSMRCIHNAHGTAPGLTGTLGNCLVFALPGPPPEMMPMFHASVQPNLPAVPPGIALLTAKVNLYGMGESLAAEKLGGLLARDRSPLIGITVSEAVISARIRAVGKIEHVSKQIESDVQQIERAWRPYVFSRGDTTLAETVGPLLKKPRSTVATAESCTGGWLGKAIVDVPGSSAYYVGGWVTYSNEMKATSLGVDAKLIAERGAVSPEVARSMAAAARDRSGAAYALSITGIAGPESDPASSKRPGLVYIALAQPNDAVSVRRFQFTGDRSAVRDRSVKSALQMLRFALIGVGDDVPLLWQVEGRG